MREPKNQQYELLVLFLAYFLTKNFNFIVISLFYFDLILLLILNFVGRNQSLVYMNVTTFNKIITNYILNNESRNESRIVYIKKNILSFNIQYNVNVGRVINIPYVLHKSLGIRT